MTAHIVWAQTAMWQTDGGTDYCGTDFYILWLEFRSAMVGPAHRTSHNLHRLGESRSRRQKLQQMVGNRPDSGQWSRDTVSARRSALTDVT